MSGLHKHVSRTIGQPYMDHDAISDLERLVEALQVRMDELAARIESLETSVQMLIQ